MDHQHYLVISAVSSYRFDLFEIFTKLTKQCGCNVLDSKLTTVGSEYSLLLHVAGTWNTIAKLEASLPLINQQQRDINFYSKRTSPRKKIEALPYQVQVIAQDRPGILYELAQFFSNNGILVERVECESYTAKNHTQMTQITLVISIPAKQHLATLREQFMLYCDERNLDALIEPFK